MTTGDTPTAVQYGVGPIGARIVEAATERGYEFRGAVDVDPEKVDSNQPAWPRYSSWISSLSRSSSPVLTNRFSP